MTEDKMVGWHYRLNRHELEQTLYCICNFSVNLKLFLNKKGFLKEGKLLE